MAIFHGGDSKYLIGQKNKNKFFGFYSLFLVFLSLILYWILQFKIRFSIVPSIVISFGMVVLGIILFKITNGFYILALKFKSGISGERMIRDEFKKLPDEYTVFQDIKIPQRFGNIDFVVVGPTGIFTIEVKNKHGKVDFRDDTLFLEDQNDKKDLTQAKREAVELHEYLETKLNSKIGFIFPVLVFTGHIDIHMGLTSHEGAYIIQKSYLNRVLTEKTSGEFNSATRSILEKEFESLAITN